MISTVRSTTVASSPRPPEREERAQPEKGPELPCPAYRATRKAAGTVVGVSLGLARLILGGCAGGAQGVARGVEPSAARLTFAVTLGANLALSGALAGAVGSLAPLALAPAQGALAGAAANTGAGLSLWSRAPLEFQDSVRKTADEWVGAVAGTAPPASGPGSVWQRIAAGLVGEVVGAAAGVYASAALLPSHFQHGFSAGQDLCDRVSRWMEPDEKDPGSAPGTSPG